MKIKEIEAYWCICMHFWQAYMQRILQQMPCRRYVWWGRGSLVPAPYPDQWNPGHLLGHYMNVFKTPTMLNDGQQQPVDNFAPRANLKWFLKTVPFHLAIVRWKMQKVGIFVDRGEACAWVYETSWGTAICICNKREFQIVLLRFRILEGGALNILKTWRGGIENLPISSTGALLKYELFSRRLHPPPPPYYSRV
jgi:hypothetical protein